MTPSMTPCGRESIPVDPPYNHLQSLIKATRATYGAEIFVLRDDPQTAMVTFRDFSERHPAMNGHKHPGNLQKHWGRGVCNAVAFSYRHFFFWRSCSEQLSKVQELWVKWKQDLSATSILSNDYIHEIATLWLFLSLMYVNIARELKLVLPGSPGMKELFSYKKDNPPDHPELIPAKDVPLMRRFVLLCSQNGYRGTALDETSTSSAPQSPLIIPIVCEVSPDDAPSPLENLSEQKEEDTSTPDLILKAAVEEDTGRGQDDEELPPTPTVRQCDEEQKPVESLISLTPPRICDNTAIPAPYLDQFDTKKILEALPTIPTRPWLILGFAISPVGGSMWWFTPKEELDLRPILFHDDHEHGIHREKALKMKGDLQKAFDWTLEKFSWTFLLVLREPVKSGKSGHRYHKEKLQHSEEFKASSEPTTRTKTIAIFKRAKDILDSILYNPHQKGKPAPVTWVECVWALAGVGFSVIAIGGGRHLLLTACTRVAKRELSSLPGKLRTLEMIFGRVWVDDASSTRNPSGGSNQGEGGWRVGDTPMGDLECCDIG
ncbi:hypothetical protein BDZ45DRAFT_748584 [Acephala macrosclerotiorum]|nr:hypothetical protein BDZ45DRAFT_748584 [Acephala macrosclerotiorum]